MVFFFSLWVCVFVSLWGCEFMRLWVYELVSLVSLVSLWGCELMSWWVDGMVSWRVDELVRFVSLIDIIAISKSFKCEELTKISIYLRAKTWCSPQITSTFRTFAVFFCTRSALSMIMQVVRFKHQKRVSVMKNNSTLVTFIVYKTRTDNEKSWFRASQQ